MGAQLLGEFSWERGSLNIFRVILETIMENVELVGVGVTSATGIVI